MSQSRIPTLLAKNSPVNASQWETILLSSLLRRPQSKSTQHDLSNLEVVANITTSSLNIVYRNTISGIHQRIGEIRLAKDEAHELDILAWVSTAVTRSKALQSDLVALQERYDGQAHTIKTLTEHLDKLTKAKAEDERELLAKFRELLNAKKLKNRDQQRLLASSVVDPARGKRHSSLKVYFRACSPTNTDLAAAKLDAERSEAPSVARRTATSRFRKRRPSHPLTETSESGFESMDAERDRGTTPDGSEDDTDSRDSEGLDPRNALQSASDASDSSEVEGGSRTGAELPPSRRNLPVTRKGEKGQGKAQVGQEDDADDDVDETDDGTSDDEL